MAPSSKTDHNNSTDNLSEPIEMNRISPAEEDFQDVELEDQNGTVLIDGGNDGTEPPVEEPTKEDEHEVVYNSEKPVGFCWIGSKIFFHTIFLLEKNLKLYLKSWISTLVQLAAPFIIVFLLWFLSVIVGSIRPESYVQTQEIPVPVDALTKCTRGVEMPLCYTLAYSVNNNTFAQKVMDNIISDYSLASSDYRAFDSETELLDFIRKNPNVTQTAISFQNDTSGLNNVFLAPNTAGVQNATFEQVTDSATRYTIWYNGTRSNILSGTRGASSTNPAVGIFVVHFKQIIDNAILFLFTGEKQLIRTNMEGYPRRPAASDGQGSIISQTGPQFFSLAASIPLVISMQMLATEKESMLRFGMVMMGLSSVSYWLSWLITFAFMAVLTTLSTIISGYIFQIHFFLRSNFLSLFFLFYIFSISLIAVAVLLSTFTNRGRSALILGFLVLSVSFILNQFLASQEFVIILFSPVCSDIGDSRQFCVQSWVRTIRVLLYFYPPFNFAKMFVDIQQATSSVYDPLVESFVAPDSGYSVADMFNSISITNTFNIDNLPPSFHSLLLLIMNIAIFLIIGLYLDAILDNNTGVQHKPWFLLKPSFWGITIFSGKKRVTAESNSKSEEELAEMDEDVRKQYDMVRNPEEELVLRLLNVKKAFKTNFGLPLISSEVNAVNGVDFGVKPGNVCALLGHNGCGKSTTINSVVGLIRPSSGDIVFLDKSVKENISYIRQNLGICPQHDILFPTLSAWEHLKLYGSIKGMSRKQIKRESTERLKAVDLYSVRNKNASTFSGGMRRRLSVAISTIGSPDLLILDECTTGLDVDVRRRIWKLIHQMQSGNRVILMTTHSMEEAEALSNQIVIMQSGKVIATGNALQLKQKYGAGYNLSLICFESKLEDTIAMVARELPEATLTNANAGNLIFNVLPEHIVALGHFIKKLETITSSDSNKEKEEKKAAITSIVDGSASVSVSSTDPKAEAAAKSTGPHQEISKQAYAQYAGLLKDWGIAFTTLERVFLKLTDQKSQMGMDETNDETQKAISLFERLKQPQDGSPQVEPLHAFGDAENGSSSPTPAYKNQLEWRSAPAPESNEENDLISVSSASDKD
eukprot:CAMPEP_0117451158 /NCGR_PEP_ID=MMETSP0759-20121206/8859_1 /TAXON_ID=63605 /ORGANISM="Percolomonas cosmopolitus, Strain WS" /LENGTH=1095 /DNA_ID=CAMNT_0005243741 /DNA_START=152 /DNA_END=3436 /DNA_ORIENTATION=+